MATTLEEFSAKLDRLDAEFAKKMEEQNKKFFADKPDESTLSPEMKEHYEKFEKMIQEHTDKFNKKMHEHSEHFKAKFAELLEQQKNAQFPGNCEQCGFVGIQVSSGKSGEDHEMLRRSRFFFFRMKNGEMVVDYKIMSRDHKRSIRVEDAVVDPRLIRTVVPLSWLEQLRSSSVRLRTGYHTEETVYVPPAYGSVDKWKKEKPATVTSTPNAVMAGPVVVYVTGQNVPIVLTPYFVPDDAWGLQKKGELDLRLGMDAIEQCTLFSELRPGGLLYHKLEENANVKRYEPVRETLRRYGMKCELSESPLVPRPWTRMRYMFIDELQRGPKLTEFVGHNPRNGSPWRFSQHTKYFRLGVWRETIRRNDMNEGLHSHSSWQKSPQQSVPDVSFLAPYP